MTYGDKLFPSCEIWLKPGERGANEKCFQPDEQYVAADRVEGSCEVQQEEDADMACVSSNEWVVYDLDQCRLCAVLSRETRLKRFP